MKLVESGAMGRVVAEESFASYLVGFLFGLVFFGVGLFMLFAGGKWSKLGPLSPDTVHWLFSGVFILAGLLLLYFNAKTTIVAEKTRGQVIVKNIHLFFLENVRTFSVAGLKAVVIQEIEHRGRGGRSYSYDLDLVYEGFRAERVFGTQDEFVLPLFGRKSSREEMIELGKGIAALFGVPYEERGVPRTRLSINLGGSGPII